VKRRNFLFGLGALAVSPVALKSLPRIEPRSDPGIPDRVDIRKGDDPGIPVNIFRNGEPIRFAVAYDLKENSVTVLRQAPNGFPLTSHGQSIYDTLKGGVVVRWMSRSRL
jgi:hypothetical protein